ncbi:MAG: DinB family protein [Terriglobales bacterium]
MLTRPLADEADPYYFPYIDLVPGDDPVRAMCAQLEEMMLLGSLSEERSLFRYAPGKWSLRESLNHVTDTERGFAFRVLWFARGYEAPLPSIDQEVGVRGAGADRIAWSAHLEEFRRVRLASIALLENLPPEAWDRRGMASGKHFSVRALAFLLPGHAAHHLKIFRERYLSV